MQPLISARPPIRRHRLPGTTLVLVVLALALTTAVSYGWAYKPGARLDPQEILELRQALEEALGHQTELRSEVDRLVRELERLQAEYELLQQQLEAEQGDRPIAYITIDDGPSQHTLEVLDILSRYGIRATFFVTGINRSGMSDIYSRIIAGGHAIGIHSYTHVYQTIYASADAYLADLLRLEDLLYEQFGILTSIMRFPGGSSNQVGRAASGYDIVVEDLIREVTGRGYDYFDWNVDSGDSLPGATASKIVATSKAQIANLNGRDLVLLFHDGPSNGATVQALPSVIEDLQARGYQFRALSRGAIDVKHRTSQG